LEIREFIGESNYARVYRGIFYGDTVAIKKFFDNSVEDRNILEEEFRKETSILSKARHTNILLIMGICVDQLAIVTEYMARGDLYCILHKKSDMLEWKLKMHLAIDIARGMNYLHSMNPPIVHHDLKSSNIFVDERWRAKVGDFGTTKIREHTFISSDLSNEGTAAWMAPECLRCEKFNEKADVYSFGVVLWELLTQQRPWRGLNPMQIVGKVGIKGDILPMPQHYPLDCPKKFINLVENCFKKPEDRPSFAQILQVFKSK